MRLTEPPADLWKPGLHSGRRKEQEPGVWVPERRGSESKDSRRGKSKRISSGPSRTSVMLWRRPLRALKNGVTVRLDTPKQCRCLPVVPTKSPTASFLSQNVLAWMIHYQRMNESVNSAELSLLLPAPLSSASSLHLQRCSWLDCSLLENLNSICYHDFCLPRNLTHPQVPGFFRTRTSFRGHYSVLIT